MLQDRLVSQASSSPISFVYSTTVSISTAAVIVTPLNSTLREGESITISCSYSGVDIDSVNWILMNR